MLRKSTENSQRTSELRREVDTDLHDKAVLGAKYEEMVKTEGWKDFKEFLMDHIEQLDRQRSQLGEAEFDKFRKIQTELRVIRMVLTIVDNKVRYGKDAQTAIEKKG